MAWGVFYRPEEVEWRPRFKVPLSTALLSDPAFSSDPRTHPHFNAPPFDPPRQLVPRQKPVLRPPQTSRKASMRALVRRLTSHHNLDRIDELDETDPFGSSYHHDGPYEAIGTTQVHPIDNVPRTNNSKHAFNPRSLHPTHQSPPRVPSIRGGKGLSLHLKPGQILQHNTIYTSVTSVQNHLSRQPDTPAIVVHRDHSPSHSPPISQARSPQDSPMHPLSDVHNRPLPPPRAPSQRRDTPNIHILPLDLDCVDAPYIPAQTTVTIFPPPRRDSRLHNLGFSPSSQPALPPSVSRKTRTTESTIPPHDTGHKSVHSVDSSHTLNNTLTRSSSNIQGKSVEPPRVRYFPKHLVMPAPLQPQPPEPQYRFPPADQPDWNQGDHTLGGTDLEGQPVVYNQGPRLLRKRSSAVPGGLPMPHHVTMHQDDAMAEMGDIPTKTDNEGETPKEKTRRRRLSKRKSYV